MIDAQRQYQAAVLLHCNPLRRVPLPLLDIGRRLPGKTDAYLHLFPAPMHAKMTSPKVADSQNPQAGRKRSLPRLCGNDAGEAEGANFGAQMTMANDVPIPLITHNMVGVDLP